jgi:hypothetical protein
MKIAGARQLRARSAHLLGGGEPVLVTRHGARRFWLRLAAVMRRCVRQSSYC